MALTDFQRTICRLLADHRIATGESYVAGAAALNELMAAPRISRDLDLFHDTDEALAATWVADERVLRERGFDVRVLRERQTYVQAEVSRGGDTVLIEWVRDSAYRFFPLVGHADLGIAHEIVERLPAVEAGRCVLGSDGRLFTGNITDLQRALERKALTFHEGSIRGAFPRVQPGR